MPVKKALVPEALRLFLGDPVGLRYGDSLIVSGMLHKIGVERSVPFTSEAISRGALEVIEYINKHLKSPLNYSHKRILEDHRSVLQRIANAHKQAAA